MPAPSTSFYTDADYSESLTNLQPGHLEDTSISSEDFSDDELDLGAVGDAGIQKLAEPGFGVLNWPDMHGNLRLDGSG